ncbi:suppressor of cytokine signaling 6 [Colletes gigas]|uniref:suppressor of cytokine signaling 6 n=1 Tax=Colletes gigas TaxID=935657 RepID=UPI001C9A715F|nr:suppressor of cytokine signaling 6 [Colletes gigas]
MISQTSEELITAAPPGAKKRPKQGTKPRKLSARTFDFLWRRNSRRRCGSENEEKKDDFVEVRIVECNVNNVLPSKTSFSFIKNMKKHMQVKKLTICKSKRKENEIQVSSLENGTNFENIHRNAETNEMLSNDNKVKASLTEELLKLSNYGWYWGPMSRSEAYAKLLSEPDGAFLVRDSLDDRYVLTLSFKSSGMLLHARMEHSGGLFSLCNQSESEGFSSVADLIDYSMNFSQSMFCYLRPRFPGQPSLPVRLTKPLSRFTQVRSLQYLCRFVIRQNTRLDNIHKLPLPKTIKGYIEEAHY